MKKLYEIYHTYTRLDLVPEGYNYATIYMHEREPYHMVWLQERIEKHKFQKQLEDEFR